MFRVGVVGVAGHRSCPDSEVRGGFGSVCKTKNEGESPKIFDLDPRTTQTDTTRHTGRTAPVRDHAPRESPRNPEPRTRSEDALRGVVHELAHSFPTFGLIVFVQAVPRWVLRHHGQPDDLGTLQTLPGAAYGQLVDLGQDLLHAEGQTLVQTVPLSDPRR